jgi:hypothetical protein
MDGGLVEAAWTSAGFRISDYSIVWTAGRANKIPTSKHGGKGYPSMPLQVAVFSGT